LLYGVASWLILQVADVLFSAMDLPSTWVRLVLALLVLGFPLVLILSWVYEMTPEGLKRESEVQAGESITPKTARKLDFLIAVLLVLAIVAIGADRFIPQESDVAEATQAAANLQEGIPSNSIAVLPFANRSAQADDAYFVDGIHDDILTQLARIGSLTVTSRTSVEQFRDTTMGIPEIGEILGVRNILEGGVQRAGDRVRINLQLIDVRSDDHLWAETFETELTASNVFEVQGDVARAVTDALSAALHPEEELALQQNPTKSIEAYELYLLGRFHTYKRTAESIELAKSYFEQAIEQDPNYVLALSGLSDANVLLEGYGNLPGDVAYPQAQAAIDKAMELDDSVSEVWTSLGLLRASTLDFPDAEQAFIRAIELDESNFSAWHWYGRLLIVMRRFDESLEAFQEAYALEPMSLVINSGLAAAYSRFGEFSAAKFHRERAAQIRPDQRIGYQLGIVSDSFEGGEFTAAIALARRILTEDPRNAMALEFTALSYLAMGDVAEASSWFSQLGSVDSTSWARSIPRRGLVTGYISLRRITRGP